ncbi:hypothetical protein SUGI_0313960 [Cryptomeria japonica]|uniref:protein WUSCHEL-like n=1 Tax=Cryptomeria japonica TaxID=3369 RepID=UPI002408C160|nr:protein WUSCHEL-like [Cryptomeria japonica]GLJ17914.1 hypothetical protein SUGI_0313960 [Cryptomeria japonica]
MDRGSAADSRLIRSGSAVESASVRSSCSRWKPTDNQKRILESLFANGTRKPCLEEIERITADLQGHGPHVQGKNVFYWFQNATAREKRMKESSSRLPSVFKARNWTSLFRSKKRSSEKSYVEGEEDRRYSSVDPSDVRTLELFPLHPGL